MTRYVDADELTEKLMREAIKDRADLLRLLTYFPTADVQEVNHGHWVESARIYGKIFCSECYSAVMGKGKDMLYCPNCGAKMDEE